VFVASGTLRGPFALVAHTLRQHAVGTSTGCPYA
jgi:hypothetical protein